MPSRYRRSLLVVFCLALVLAWPKIVAAASLSQAELTGQINAILNSAPLSKARVGISVVRLSDGQQVFENKSDEAFIPASNQKLVTAAAALGLLGPDFRFRTLLYSNGSFDGSKNFRGNLYLKGYGDPTLARSDLAVLIQVLKDHGVRTVIGDLLADDSYFSGPEFGPGWLLEYRDKYYSAPASALSLEGNVVKISVSPGARAGAKANWQADPGSPLVSIENDCVTAKRGARCWTSLTRISGNAFRLGGRIAAGHAPIVHVITVENASLFTASVFAEMLKAAGISLKGPTHLGRLPRGAILLASDSSSPLSEILAEMNKDSDNHVAEQVLRTIGAEIRAVGDYLDGAQAVSDYLNSLLPGVQLPVIRDGCGLDRGNSLSPHFLAALLARLPSLPHWQSFLNSLAIGGEDGTLKRRFKSSATRGKIHAKTGTLTSACSLSGYVMGKGKREGTSPSPTNSFTDPGRPALAFSILVNDFTSPVTSIRQAEDKICEVLCEYGEGM